MNIRIEPRALAGALTPPPSKSHLMRLLLAAALADKPTLLYFDGALCADNRILVAGLRAAGAGIDPLPEGLRVTPLPRESRAPVTLDCGESGAALRFLLPVLAALGIPARYTGQGRLPARPIGELPALLRAHGCDVSADALPLTVSGTLHGDSFEVGGGLTSQTISGVLLALPLLGGGEIRCARPPVSRGYIEMTADVLRLFGVSVQCDKTVFSARGRYASPGRAFVEPDLSAAAVWRAVQFLGGNITLAGLPAQSRQPDSAFETLCPLLGTGKPIDCAQTPDLLPILATAACGRSGQTVFTGAARLRHKESDRLTATAAMLSVLGAQADVTADGLTVIGRGMLAGGSVKAAGDHRIAMAAAAAAYICRGSVTIEGADCVDKSYPAFWADYESLGGVLHVL